jgi:hypothetical protein
VEAKRRAITLEEMDWVVVRCEGANQAHFWEGPYQIVMRTNTTVWVFDLVGRLVDSPIADVRKVLEPM